MSKYPLYEATYEVLETPIYDAMEVKRLFYNVKDAERWLESFADLPNSVKEIWHYYSEK